MHVGRVLKEIGFRPRRGLGQNFLCDASVLARIVEAAAVEPDRTVLEVGAGLGVLTRELVRRADRVVALEIDPVLHAYLERTLPAANLTLLRRDLLDYDFADLPASGVTVVGNLPYASATAMLLRLLEQGPRFQRILAMLQREVAQRLAAEPGTKSYGSLSVAVQFRARPRVLFTVPPRAFRPAPKVESALVELAVRDRPAVEVTDPDLFFRVVRAAFAQRRKTLLNALRRAGGFPRDRVEAALAAAGIAPARRGETLSLAEFAALSDFLL